MLLTEGIVVRSRSRWRVAASARRPKALADGSENFTTYPAASGLRSQSGYFGGVGCCGELHFLA